jgi:NAD-dependent deacetylase
LNFDLARRLVSASARIVALTGAGISTESGIPDFRGPNGVWTRNPKAERMSNIHDYMSDPDVRKLSWQARLNSPAWQAQPNDGHPALVGLERAGPLHAAGTQNIDGLHTRSGISAVVIECTEPCGSDVHVVRVARTDAARADRARSGETIQRVTGAAASSRARRSRSVSRFLGDRACDARRDLW